MAASRLIVSARAAGIHLVCSGIVVLCVVALVYGVWYPPPFAKIAGGTELIAIFVIVDALCGPALTFIVFNPIKNKSQLFKDLAFVGALQLIALVYGVYSIVQARPLWLAFEGDRYRVVTKADIDPAELSKAPLEMQNLSLTGPKTLGVHLITGEDPDFLRSIQLSLQGVHPSFRPERWVPYATQVSQVITAAKPVALLYDTKPEFREILNKAVKTSKLTVENLKYLPLAVNSAENWIVLLDGRSAEPKAYAQVDAW